MTLPLLKARLLGFAPMAGLDGLRQALDAIPGPPVHACHGPGIAALMQPEPDAPLAARARADLAADLLTVQRRLERACLAGPFLPMDPAAACCPAEALSGVLASAWPALIAALAAHGSGQQWDVILRWTPEPVIARNRARIAAAAPVDKQALADAIGAALLTDRGRREAALLTALAPAIRALAAGGAACTETQVAVTVLVDRDAEAAVEAALDALPPETADGAAIDMKGPLPPLSFAAVRLESLDEQAIIRAWRMLDLPDRADLATLHRHWRLRAATVHPDRRPAEGEVTFADLTGAYRVLRPLTEPGGTFQTLNSLLRHAGPRLIIPQHAGPTGPTLGPTTGATPGPIAEPALELV